MGSSAIVPAVGYELVTYEVADGVATVTLNNPEKRNMLSGQMLAELVDAMKAARDSEDVRAVVLTGAGDKVFCAGADLGGFAADVAAGRTNTSPPTSSSSSSG